MCVLMLNNLQVIKVPGHVGGNFSRKMLIWGYGIIYEKIITQRSARKSRDMFAKWL